MTRELAYHEAAHGVAAVALGIPVRRCTIEPSYLLGAPGHMRPACEIKKIDMDAMLLVWLAGGAAERKLTGRSAQLDSDDQTYANLTAATMGRESDEKPAALRLERYTLLANCLVSRHWKWIERTARALMKHKTLDGKQIERLRNERTRT